MSNIALVTGITGQDGSYLSELLLEHDYEVHGIVRRSSSTVRTRIDHLTRDPEIYGQRLFLHYADLDDGTTIRRLMQKIRPTEVYHLAGQSHVGASFEIPESTCQFAAMGTLRLLEILRDCDPIPKILHTSSSEIFGEPETIPQNELTEFRPVTPYGVAKTFATNMIRVYRESFGFFACNAICYNHESPRRGESFVTRKIVRTAARIKKGIENELVLGNLDGERDWGFAPDFVQGFWKMLQRDQPEDLVFATGQKHTVRDWLNIAFAHVDLDWRQHVRHDAKFARKADPCRLVGDSSRAAQRIQWQPKTTFEDMVRQMVDVEMANNRR